MFEIFQENSRMKIRVKGNCKENAQGTSKISDYKEWNFVGSNSSCNIDLVQNFLDFVSYMHQNSNFTEETRCLVNYTADWCCSDEQEQYTLG